MLKLPSRAALAEPAGQTSWQAVTALFPRIIDVQPCTFVMVVPSLAAKAQSFAHVQPVGT